MKMHDKRLVIEFDIVVKADPDFKIVPTFALTPSLIFS